MRARCNDRSHAKYARYGGRGIEVCPRWSCFENFLEDMRVRPSKKHTLDRIDNDGDYTPENCRWATPQQQAANTSTNRIIEFEGQELHLAAWARRTGIAAQTLHDRLFKHGWEVSKALTTPPRHRV